MTVQPNRADGPAVQWRPEQDVETAFPESLASLLVTTGSMTGALRERCDGQFALTLLKETRVALGRYQSGTLGDAQGTVREVLMGCAGAPWVFAQTLIPAPTVRAHPWLASLDDTPLGDELFARSNVTRSPLLFALLGPCAPLHQRIATLLDDDALPSLWARRSQFDIGPHSLLINEVFLPALQSCPTS